jgi:hypothetical protein
MAMNFIVILIALSLSLSPKKMRRFDAEPEDELPKDEPEDLEQKHLYAAIRNYCAYSMP